AYGFGARAVLRDRRGGRELVLSTSGGVSEAGPVEEPFFFSGFLTDPAVAARGMLACAAVARARYIRDPGAAAAIRGPVVASNQGRRRFEAFVCGGGGHAPVGLGPSGRGGGPVGCGAVHEAL